MKRTSMWTATLLLGGLLALAGTPRAQVGAEVALRAAMETETVKGDLHGAIEQYRQIAEGADRAIAATALVRMAGCYEKLGAAEAGAIYERVVSDYSDQREQVITAQAKLAALAAAVAGSQTSAGVTIRKLAFGAEDPTQEVAPWNVSADGRYLGATDYETGNAALVDVIAGTHRNVTDYGNWDQENGYIDVSAISRDGARIAFWHYKYSATEGTLRVVDADGTGEEVLLRGDDVGRGWGIPTDWSPDGRYIALDLEGTESDTLGRGVMDFALVPVDGGEMRVVKTSRFVGRHRPKLLFSPDGGYLAYDFPPRVGTRQTDLYVLPVSGGEETVVAEHPARDTFVGWTPDGDILFLSDRTGAIGLYGIAMEDGRQSGEPQLLKDGVGEIQSFGVADSGALYYADTRQSWNAYFAALDFSTGRLLSTPESITDRFEDSVSMPAWSRNGRSFSYVRHRAGGATSTMIIRDVASGDERELLPAVTLSDSGSQAQWYPDGTSLLAIGTKDDQRGLYRIDIDTGEATIVGGTEPFASADWSRDAASLFYNGGEDRSSMNRRNLETGDERTIYRGVSGTRSYRVSPDGSLIAFVQRQADPNDPRTLLVMPTDGGRVREIVSAPPAGDGFSFSSLSTAWSKDSSHILFVRRVVEGAGNGNSALWIVPAEGGGAQITDLVLSSRIGEISFDPGSDRFAFSTESNTTEFWVMENFLPAQ